LGGGSGDKQITKSRRSKMAYSLGLNRWRSIIDGLY
jgi:hypothetical protein